MPTTTASDIISEQAVRSVLEEQLTKTYQFRRVFQDHDATDISNDRFSFPQREVELDRDDVVEVGEGENYARTGTDYGEVTVVYDKRGFEISISDEAVSDSRVDVEMDTETQAMNAWQGTMDYLAFQVLDSNQNAAGPIGDDNGTITYQNLVDARTTLFGDQYDLSEMVGLVGSDGMGDLLKMDEFTQASEMGDFVLENGLLPNGQVGPMFLGEAAGVPWYATNTGDLAQGEAFVVDTSRFGYESTRWDREIRQYRDEDADADVWKLRGRNGWVAFDPSANVKIEA